MDCETLMVLLDVNAGADVQGVAVLLHPHPDFGGNRFHPFIDGLFRRLPEVSVAALRFDFLSADASMAREQVLAAIDEAGASWPQLPVVLAGYSFGAAVAAGINDERVVAWYLLAPPAAGLASAAIGHDGRPKAIVVPEYDQFSPPPIIEQTVVDWVETTVTTAYGADHFLGPVAPLVDAALTWIGPVAGQ